MKKADVKALVEADDKLQWWAAVLFAEICDLGDYIKSGGDTRSAWSIVESKIDEFPRLVIQRQVEQAGGKQSDLELLKKRVAALEGQVAFLLGG